MIKSDPTGAFPTWQAHQMDHVENVMEKEFPNLNPGLIAVAVRLAARAVAPCEGLANLLAAVRGQLARRQAEQQLLEVS